MKANFSPHLLPPKVHVFLTVFMAYLIIEFFKESEQFKKNSMNMCVYRYIHVILIRRILKLIFIITCWKYQLQPFYLVKFLISNLICCLHKMEAQFHKKWFSIEYDFLWIVRQFDLICPWLSLSLIRKLFCNISVYFRNWIITNIMCNSDIVC